MPEIDARQAYEAVMAELQRQLPELYLEVLDEIERGQELEISKIPEKDASSRNRELKNQRLAKLSDRDLTLVPLTPEERLVVIARAIAVATDNHDASIRTLARFGEQNGANRILFVNPNEDPIEGSLFAVDGGQEARVRNHPINLHSDDLRVTRWHIDQVFEALNIADENH